MDALPIVCNLGELGPKERERQRELLSAFTETVLETRDLEDGFAFRLPAEKLMEAAEIIAIERRCCAFLRLSLEADASSPFVWLRLTGPPGTREFLEAELKLTGRRPTP